jgi:hypothetical protein
MQISDEAELWALLIAIIECKFGQSSCSLDLAGSAPLARVIDRLWEDFRQTRLFHIAVPAGGWEAWRQLTPARAEWDRVISWIKATKTWNSLSIEDRREYVRLLALPHVIPVSHEGLLLSIYGFIAVNS